MPWGSEVIGHAVILSCPVAACYAARVLARLSAQPEEQSFFTPYVHRSPLKLQRTFIQPLEPKQFRQAEDVMQYSNATFSFETQSGAESLECEEDDLEFYMLTPQEAISALGDHATQFKKIYVNGLTFVEQADEEGTMLSLDEYACRMQSVVAGGVRTADDYPSSPPSPSTGYQLEAQASYGTDCGACSLASSLCSGSSSILGGSDFDRTSSHRTSFEQLSPLSSSPCSTSPQLNKCKLQKSTGTAEAQQQQQVARLEQVPSSGVSHVEHSRTEAWAEAAACADCTSMASEHSEPTADCSSTPVAISSPQGSCHSRHSRRTFSGPKTMLPGRKCAESSPSAAGDKSSRQLLRRRTTSSVPAVTPQPPSASLRSSVSCKHGSVASSGRAAPLPLPPCSAHFIDQSETSSSRQSGPQVQESSNEASLRLRAVQSSPGAPSCLYPRPAAACVSTPSAVVCPTGLSKAPALPLPDGSTVESEVPPALRYYLAQARAASVGGTESASSRAPTTPDIGSRAAEGSSPPSPKSAGGADCVVRQPGFVRATVEQLNTQRLVCCHVTPFAAAKTCKTPRSLGQRGAAAWRN